MYFLMWQHPIININLYGITVDQTIIAFRYIKFR